MSAVATAQPDAEELRAFLRRIPRLWECCEKYGKARVARQAAQAALNKSPADRAVEAFSVASAAEDEAALDVALLIDERIGGRS